MMSNYIDLNLTLDYLQGMTYEDACHYFPRGDGISFRQLVANIILSASKIHWEGERGVREFWYNPIKPIVLKLFPDVNTLKVGKNKEKAFNGILSDLVKEGRISYKDLGIVDFRTMRKIYQSKDRSNCWHNIILFVEKDSAYIHLRPIKELLNITILSGAGWSNTAAAEAIRDNLDEVEDYDFYAVTDHDNFGYNIGREAAKKLETLGLPINNYKRIAITPSQVPGTIQESQKYPIKMNLTDSVEWCEEHALEGPNGKVYGLEIEAISGQPGGAKHLRKIVLEALLEDLEEYDRNWELTETRWEHIPEFTMFHYLDAETLAQWENHDVLENIDLEEYLNPSEFNNYNENSIRNREEETHDLDADLENAEREVAAGQRFRDENVSENYVEYKTKIKELHDEHIAPLEEKIRELKDLHITPLEEEMEEKSSEIFDDYDSKWVEGWEQEVSRIESELEEINNRYDEHESNVQENYDKSRALYAYAHDIWLKKNIHKFIEIAPETEELSFGLMTGFLLEALENEENADDLIRTVTSWDTDRIHEYIGNEMDNNANVVAQITTILNDLIRVASQ